MHRLTAFDSMEFAINKDEKKGIHKKGVLEIPTDRNKSCSDEWRKPSKKKYAAIFHSQISFKLSEILLDVGAFRQKKG